MNARSEAAAFRIWGLCHPNWQLTFNEVAEALDISVQQIEAVVKAKGWGERFETEMRASRSHSFGRAMTPVHMQPERTMDTPHRYLSDEAAA